MIDYINNVITDFSEEITGSSPTPHADHLFKIRDEDGAKYLSEEDAQQFHRTTAHNHCFCNAEHEGTFKRL